MSWSLGLQNGDLTLGNASYGTITGEKKLVQDLRCYLLEQMGTDDMHPDYGSLINGGRLANGTIIRGSIGKLNNSFAEADITSEINRIIGLYQARQLERAKDDRLTYGKTTFTRGEILLSVSQINVTHRLDSLYINLVLLTGDKTSLDLNIDLT